MAGRSGRQPPRTPVELAIQALNRLKQSRIIRDYAIIGAYAFTYHAEPVATVDLDIVVQADTDTEFIEVYQAVRQHGLLQGDLIILGGMPVQIFPTSISPLYEDALRRAKKIRVGGLRCKVIAAEHLVIMFALANRVRDRIRIAALAPQIDRRRLARLLEGFDDDGKAAERLRQAGIAL